MICHVDTTFLVDLLREHGQKETGPASLFLEQHLEDDFQMSLFVSCELFAGAERSGAVEREREKVQELCRTIPIISPPEDFAPTYGRLLAGLQREGEVIACMDLLIATSAVTAKCPLVTRNLRHFQRVPGLRLLPY